MMFTDMHSGMYTYSLGFFCFFFSFLSKISFKDGEEELAHWAKVFVTKTNDPSLIPGIYMEGNNQISLVVHTHTPLQKSLIKPCA